MDDLTAKCTTFFYVTSDYIGKFIDFSLKYIPPAVEYVNDHRHVKKHLTLIVSSIALLLDNMLYMAIVPIATEILDVEANASEGASSFRTYFIKRIPLF